MSDPRRSFFAHSSFRMLLAFATAAWIGAQATPAGAQGALPPDHPPIGAASEAALDPDAAAVLQQAGARAAQAGGPIDRAFVVSLVGEPEDPVPASEKELEEKTHAIASLLRCPVCQGSAVADSPSSMAIHMKNEVRDLVALGFGRDQILRYFEASYGQFVRMQPKAEGINWLVWLLPGALFVGGLAVVGAKLRRSALQAAADERVPARDELPEDPALADAVRRVRELAYGWPGGVPPRAKGEG